MIKLAFTDIPDYGDHVTLEEFKQWCVSGAVSNDDGIGYFATTTGESQIMVDCSNILKNIEIPEFATHVVWYNK